MDNQDARTDQRPTLTTERLILRPFRHSDAQDIQRLAGHRLIYATTGTIPHPYPDGAAEEWIAKQFELFREGLAVQFAITSKQDGVLLGCIDLFAISRVHKRAELGYWIGVDYWNRGYCTEAAREIVKFGFDCLQLNKIVCRHVAHNPKSGKIMEKIGMQKVGVFRQDFYRDGEFFDIVFYEILRAD